MARRHLQRLLTACVLLVLLACAPSVAAGQPPRLPPSESAVAPANLDNGDDVRLVDDAVRVESSDRDGIPTAALTGAATDPATQRTGLPDHGHDGQYGRSARAGASPRAPPPGI